VTETSVELTFVLPVKDGEEHLTETLEGVDAFVRNSDLKCEVIAVDDGSSDSTPALLREFGSDHA